MCGVDAQYMRGTITSALSQHPRRCGHGRGPVDVAAAAGDSDWRCAQRRCVLRVGQESNRVTNLVCGHGNREHEWPDGADRVSASACRGFRWTASGCGTRTRFNIGI